MMTKQSLRPARRWAWLLLLATAVFLLSACGGPNAAQEPQPGDVVAAFVGDLAASATATGRLYPQRETTLSVATPGRIETILVREGDAVQAGDVLVQLEADDLALAVANAEQTLALREANLAGLLEEPAAADVAAAQAAVASARANLDDLQDGPTETELASAEANLRSAEASLWSASAELNQAQASIKESQIKAAEAALVAAQQQQRIAREANEEETNAATHEALMEANQAVAEAEGRLADLLAGPETGAAAGGVAAAAARRDAREANLSLQQQGATATELASADAQLAQAEAQLASLIDGPTEEEIAQATAEVEQARLSLEDAQDALDDATLTAPFAGVVTAVHYAEGEVASGAVIELVDLNNLEVILEVDEVDIGDLEPGQSAMVTLETWPDEEIESTITTIAPSGGTDPGTSLVTYDVHLELGETELPARVGMTANAELVTARRDEVLLVPNRAIKVDRQSGTYSVTLVEEDGEGNQTTRDVPVTIGLRDAQYTQITNGLNPGDEILIGNELPVQDFSNGGGPFSE